MVPTSDSAVCRSSTVSAIRQGPPVPTMSHLGCGKQLMQFPKQNAFQKGFVDSQQLLGEPPQTKYTMLGDYTLLAGPRNKELIHLIPLPLKKSLFAFTFRTHALASQMVKGYRSSLAKLLNHTGKGSVVQNRIISNMITSVKLEWPRITIVLPAWNLFSLLVINSFCWKM